MWVQVTDQQQNGHQLAVHEAALRIGATLDLVETCKQALEALSSALDAPDVVLTVDDPHSRAILGRVLRYHGPAAATTAHLVTQVKRIGVFGTLRIELPESTQSQQLLNLLTQRLEDAWRACLQKDELERTHSDLLNRRDLDRKIGRALAYVTNTDELAVTIDRLLETIFPVQYNACYFLDPESGELTLGFAKDFEDWEAEDALRTAWHRHPGLVIRTGRVVDVPDIDADPEHLTSTSLRRHKIKSRLYLPVRFGEEVIGAIGLASTRAHEFNEMHRDALTFLTDIAGLTWGRIREEKSRERRERLLCATSEISTRLLATPDWRSISEQILELVANAIGADSASIVEFGVSFESCSLAAYWPPTARPEEAYEFTEAHKKDLHAGTTISNCEHGDGSCGPIHPGEPRRPAMIALPIRAGSTTRGAVVVESRKGNVRWDEVMAEAIRTVADAIAAADSRSRLESALRHSQKLEAIGTLAGGIAHDFNNLLWPILTYTQLLRERVQDSTADEMLSDIESATKRASELVSQILDLSRHMEPRREVIALREVVTEAVRFLRRSIPASITLHEDLQDVGNADLDASGIHQIVLNLCTNACQAMPSGGSVSIQLSKSDENAATLLIEDDGPGMDEHTLSHLFDPYFTTKASSGGTGLGLAIVRGIVDEFDGKIDVVSHPGIGTRLQVSIPIVGDDVRVTLPKGLEDLSAKQKGMRLLVVDDDPFVGSMCAELLESFGYEVELFQDGNALLERVRTGSEPFAGVVTDLSMPEMSGIDLTRALRATHPDLPIVCCTGFGSDALEREALNAGVTCFARKPLDLDEFGRILRLALSDSVATETPETSAK